MNQFNRSLLWTAALLGGFALTAGSSFAAAPTTSLIEGMMTSAGGGAAADGTYDVVFSVYEAGSGGNATWSEGPVKVAVKGGQFSYALGTTKTLDITKLAALKSQWLGLKVGADPELARVKLHASLFALHAGAADKLTCTGCITADQVANGSLSAAKLGFNYAGSKTKGGPASDLACSGCVTVDELKFDKDVDLGGNSIKAKNGTFTGDVAAGTVTATSFAGDGSKLTGIKTPSGECKNKGEVVKGINADGSLKCVAALDPTALPADGLNEISNNLLTNQFVYSVAAPTKKVAIPDNQGTDAVSNITFPNIGTAQSLDVNVKVENTDLSNISMILLPPDDKKTGYVLCDPCGKKDEKKFDKTYNKANPPKEQKGAGKKIDGWIGANPQGLWTLKVKDVSFCVPQAPGNSVYCDATNAKDGWIADWSVKMQYISNQKVAVAGNMNVSGQIQVGTSSSSCGADQEGALRYNKAGKYMEYCNGQGWGPVHKPATYRWAAFDTYQWPYNWFAGNNSAMFGGVHPSQWTDGNYQAQHMSSNTDVLMTIFSKKGYAKWNSTVWAENYLQRTSTNGKVSMALFRVRNTTSKAVTWPVYWYYTSYSGWSERASAAVNGKHLWEGNCGSTTCSRKTDVSIPADRTSTVIFVSTSGTGYGYNGNHYRQNVLAFYNNCLKLPAGLSFVDDLDTKPDGWTK